MLSSTCHINKSSNFSGKNGSNYYTFFLYEEFDDINNVIALIFLLIAENL